VSEQADLASPVVRLATWLLDCALLSIVLVPMHVVAIVERPGQVVGVVLFVATIAVIAGYKALFEGAAAGATPAKRLIGLRVIGAHTGDPIGYRRSTLRALGFVVGCLRARRSP
jgi:uncharacterized RDD family membrane protein YckC